MRGARPDLKVIEGGPQDDQDADKQGVPAASAHDVPDVPPPPPATLPAEMVDEWNTIVADLKKRHLFNDTMIGSVEQYLVARWGIRRAQKMIEEHGELIKGPGGVLKANPALGLLRTSQDTASRLGAELGLTPTARSRKTLQPQPGPDLFSDKWDL